MKFDVEWLGAPGVRDRVLAATWGQLRIEAGDRDVIELVHRPSDTRRVGVYGPVFPLAEWLVESWWSLLHEPPPRRGLGTGGRDTRSPDPGWVQRHNIFTAREGMALPDAVLWRDGDDVVIRWSPDPGEEPRSRVRFVGQGQVRVPVEEVEEAVAALVEATLQRAEAVVGEDEDVRRVRDAWTAIRTADAGERDLCRSLALLGLDPYDPEEATPRLEDLLARLSREVPAALRDDLLEGVELRTLEDALVWLERSRALLAAPGDRDGAGPPRLRWAASAHETGYRLARKARSEWLGLGAQAPIADLHGLLVQRLAWDRGDDPVREVAPSDAWPARSGERALDGLVGPSKDSGRPVVVVPARRSPTAERFLLARAAFFELAGAVNQGRLVTRAATRWQRASRAFAAELLAPVAGLEAALAGRVGGFVSWDEAEELAHDFGVNPILISHQLENHDLGTVTA